jgi:hypothetical protein
MTFFGSFQQISRFLSEVYTTTTAFMRQPFFIPQNLSHQGGDEGQTIVTHALSHRPCHVYKYKKVGKNAR